MTRVQSPKMKNRCIPMAGRSRNALTSNGRAVLINGSSLEAWTSRGLSSPLVFRPRADAPRLTFDLWLTYRFPIRIPDKRSRALSRGGNNDGENASSKLHAAPSAAREFSAARRGGPGLRANAVAIHRAERRQGTSRRRVVGDLGATARRDAAIVPRDRCRTCEAPVNPSRRGCRIAPAAQGDVDDGRRELVAALRKSR